MDQNFGRKVEEISGQRRLWGGADLDGDIYRSSTLGRRADSLIITASLAFYGVQGLGAFTVSLTHEVARRLKNHPQNQNDHSHSHHLG